jgi:hypothetical protein
MSKLNSRVVAGTVAGLAVAGGGAAVAATHLTSPKRESQVVVNDAARQLGVEPSKLSDALKQALENRVDASVAAGRLTKAEGEQLKRRIASGNVPLFAGPSFGGRGDFHHFGPFGGLEAAASYLGLTEAQLDTRLRDGKSLAEIAKAKGKSVDGLVDAMVTSLKKHLDAAVSAGGMTKAEETAILADAKARITDFVNGKRPAFGDRGRGFRFRDGPPPGAAMGDPGI